MKLTIEEAIDLIAIVNKEPIVDTIVKEIINPSMRLFARLYGYDDFSRMVRAINFPSWEKDGKIAIRLYEEVWSTIIEEQHNINVKKLTLNTLLLMLPSVLHTGYKDAIDNLIAYAEEFIKV